jgi:hypothetical protein
MSRSLESMTVWIRLDGSVSDGAITVAELAAGLVSEEEITIKVLGASCEESRRNAVAEFRTIVRDIRETHFSAHSL